MRMPSSTVRSTMPIPKPEQIAPTIPIFQPLPYDTTASGIVLPDERSHKQRHFAFCANPACRVNGQEFRFEIEHSLVPCPKCGANKPPYVGMLAKIHLSIPDPNGRFEGVGGLKYRIACDTKNSREVISTLTNHELATGDRSVCNCEDCLKVVFKKNIDEIGATIHLSKGE